MFTGAKKKIIEERKVEAIIDNKRSITSRKDFVWLDIEFYDGEFFVSQKLSNYFAQLEERSNERIDAINNYVIEIYKTLDFNFYFFKENLDVRDEDEDDLLYFEDLIDVESFNDVIDVRADEFNDSEYIEENILENDINENFDNEYNDVFNNSDNNKNLNIINNNSENFNEGENSENSENFDEDSFVQFFVPLAIVCYRNYLKTTDFYLGNEFKQHLFFKKNIVSITYDLILKKFLNKKYALKIFNKVYFNRKYKKFNSLKSNFFKMLNNSNIFFFKRKYYTNKSHRRSKKYRKKKKKKLLMFKKLNLKHKIEKTIILKNFKWFSNVYLCMLMTLKTLHSYTNYSHINFLQNLYGFLSQMHRMKSKLYKRYKRRRRLKKGFFRNFEGKIGKLIKEINDKEDNRKIKRRNRR